MELEPIPVYSIAVNNCLAMSSYLSKSEPSSITSNVSLEVHELWAVWEYVLCDTPCRIISKSVYIAGDILNLANTMFIQIDYLQWTSTGKSTYHAHLTHYNDVIMSAMASQITSLSIVYSTVYSRRRSKKTSKALRHWSLWGEFTGDRWIPAQRTSNAENITSWYLLYCCFWAKKESLCTYWR